MSIDRNIPEPEPTIALIVPVLHPHLTNYLYAVEDLNDTCIIR